VHKSFRSNSQPTVVFTDVANDEHIVLELKTQHGLEFAEFNEQPEQTYDFTRILSVAQNSIFCAVIPGFCNRHSEKLGETRTTKREVLL